MSEGVKQLVSLQEQAYQSLGLPVPELGSHFPNPADDQRYFASNPDVSQKQIARLAKEREESRTAQNRQISPIGPPGARRILAGRVSELEEAVRALGYGSSFDSTVFGLTPGGGLDAYAVRFDSDGGNGIMIPQGLFDLANLTAKLIILVQPLTGTPGGPVYPANSDARQFDLGNHPYVRFRHADLHRGLFLNGDPAAALPYLRALPWQDRFAYLMVGTELFVLAHEFAHIALGHLERDAAGTYSGQQELDADRMAFRIVHAFFQQKVNLPAARTTLCGQVFMGILHSWRATVNGILGTVGLAYTEPEGYPALEDRYLNYAEQVEHFGETSVPPWYRLVHNGILLTTRSLGESFQRELLKDSPDPSSFSNRALPGQYADLGSSRAPRRDSVWTATIAGLLTASTPEERLLGLWFLVELEPDSALALYHGIASEDPARKQLCQTALMSIEPIYRAYLPRLEERFAETARTEQESEYRLHLAEYLSTMARVKLGTARCEGTPMSENFFDALPDSDNG